MCGTVGVCLGVCVCAVSITVYSVSLLGICLHVLVRALFMHCTSLFVGHLMCSVHDCICVCKHWFICSVSVCL